VPSNKDKTFKTKEELAVIAETAIGKDKEKEIITYCDIGQCCPIWSYILMEVLGYKNVRLYDGAMQEWMQDRRRRLQSMTSRPLHKSRDSDYIPVFEKNDLIDADGSAFICSCANSPEH